MAKEVATDVLDKGATLVGSLADIKYTGGLGGPVAATLSAHVLGIKHGLAGDAPNAAKVGGGLFGALSGGVIGAVAAGPYGAAIGAAAGGVAVGEGAKAIVEAYGHPSNEAFSHPPKELGPEQRKNLVSFLGKYHRQPPIRGKINRSSFAISRRDGHNVTWNYGNNNFPVAVDLRKSDTVYVRHDVGGIECVSEFTLKANGDVEEWDPQKDQRWLWKRERS